MIQDSFTARFTANANPAAMRRVEALKKLATAYLVTRRDEQLEQQIQFMIEQAIASDGLSAEQAAEADLDSKVLFVIGESRVGKSRAVRRALARRPEFQPDGDFLPLVSLLAPTPCGEKQLARAMSRALGYPIKGNPPDHIVWEGVRDRLVQRRVRFIHIDEMHQAMRTKDVQRVRDTIKTIVELPGWPVRFILSGIPELAEFFGEMQAWGRKNVIEFGQLEFPDHRKLIGRAVTYFVEECCGFQRADDMKTDEFHARLCHAASKRLGLVFTLTRHAIQQFMDDQAAPGAIGMEHYRLAYRALSGCKTETNIFSAENWEQLEPSKALFFVEEDKESEE